VFIRERERENYRISALGFLNFVIAFQREKSKSGGVGGSGWRRVKIK
jgi:hypothetical protein